MHKKNLPTQPARRVMARVLAEDLNKIHGGDGYPIIVPPQPDEPTISEAATAESIPDH